MCEGGNNCNDLLQELLYAISYMEGVRLQLLYPDFSILSFTFSNALSVCLLKFVYYLYSYFSAFPCGKRLSLESIYPIQPLGLFKCDVLNSTKSLKAFLNNAEHLQTFVLLGTGLIKPKWISFYKLQAVSS